MNAISLSLTIIVVCLVSVVLLAAVGPMIVQDATSGNSGGAFDNVSDTVDGWNQILEDSPIGDFFAKID